MNSLPRTSLVRLLAAFLGAGISTAAFADHFYTTAPSGELAPAAGYKPDGVVAFVFRGAGEGRVPVHRWYHPGRNAHFYTTHGGGEHSSSMGYAYEGVAFFCSPNPGSGLVPFHRWQHEKDIKHFYTRDSKGELAPNYGYKYEGVLCYVNPTQVSGTAPLFRWFYRSSAGNQPKNCWVCENDPNGGPDQRCQNKC